MLNAFDNQRQKTISEKLTSINQQKAYSYSSENLSAKKIEIDQQANIVIDCAINKILELLEQEARKGHGANIILQVPAGFAENYLIQPGKFSACDSIYSGQYDDNIYSPGKIMSEDVFAKYLSDQLLPFKEQYPNASFTAQYILKSDGFICGRTPLHVEFRLMIQPELKRIIELNMEKSIPEYRKLTLLENEHASLQEVASRQSSKMNM